MMIGWEGHAARLADSHFLERIVLSIESMMSASKLWV